ncbi:MAG: Hpt domain-containing protein [Prochlorotrichaceae cyanobacterium]
MNPSDVPLDWKFLNTLADHDREFAKELLQMYFEDCQSYMQILAQAIEAQNYELLYSTAHYLVGASSNVGAIHIVNCAKNLEQLARTKQIGNAVDLLKSIQADFQKIQELLIQGF